MATDMLDGDRAALQFMGCDLCVGIVNGPRRTRRR